jgi:uncharacterized protein (DUF302 family)
MNFLKNILSLVGVVLIVLIVGAYVKYDVGSKMDKVGTLDPQAMPAYMAMFDKVLETGNSAEAMIKKVKIEDEVSTEQLVENFKEIALGANFKVVGDQTMSNTGVDAKGEKTKLIRFVSFCSPQIAKIFINFSPAYSAFMPCRIAIIEEDDGSRWMYTMSMDLMLFGGKTLPPEMLAKAKHVKNTMYLMMDQAGKEDGDF